MRHRAVIAGGCLVLGLASGCAGWRSRRDAANDSPAVVARRMELSQDATAAMDHGDLPRARAGLETLAAESPRSAELHFRLGKVAQLQADFGAAEIAAIPVPSGNPQDWSMLQRARASYDAERSGDVVVLLRRGVSPIAQPGPGYVSTHGSPWDYDRRVPLLFWRKGMTGFEQPAPVETVDIAPTLAHLVGLQYAPGQFDGRCLDLDAGAGDTCGATP